MTLVVVDAENTRRSQWPNVSREELVRRARAWAEHEGHELLVVFDGVRQDVALTAASVRARSPCSNPRHRSVVMNTSVPTWFVMNRTSRSRRIGMSGFWIAPRRASA